MEKIKLFLESEKGRNVLTVLIIILVGVVSFELGRLSIKSEAGSLKIEYPAPEFSQGASAVSAFKSSNFSQNTAPKSQTSKSQSPVGNAYFASSRGSKYYHIGCSGGKTLKPENKIYFSTASEAESAGYELSSTCK